MHRPWRIYIGSIAHAARRSSNSSNVLLFHPSLNLSSRSCIRFIQSSTRQQTSYHQQQARPRLRFRPVPAFAALLLAQLFVIWDVSKNTDLFETGNAGKFLSNSQFLPYTILSKNIISANSCILTLRPGVSTSPVEDCTGSAFDAWRFRLRRGLGRPPVLTTQDIQNLRQYQETLWKEGIWSIEIKQPQMSITRQYTPLPPDYGQLEINGQSPSLPNIYNRDPGVFRLFIRREPEGEVSRYLYGLPEGSTIELRGGFVDYQIPADVRQLTFIAGGTGIAPALAAAYGLALRRVDADVHILWANRRSEDCAGGTSLTHQPSTSFVQKLIRTIKNAPPIPDSNQHMQMREQCASIVQQLENMRINDYTTPGSAFPRIDTKYFVDEEGSFIQKQDIASALRTSPGNHHDTEANRRLVLVSGPEGFVDHVAGPKLLRHGHELQGPRGGLLAQLDLTGWEVWKL